MSGFAHQRFQDLGGGFRLGDLRSPAALRDGLRGAVIGQDEAVEAVVRALTIAAVGLRDPHRPIASLLLVGPTGVGKTELARQVAQHVRGDVDNLCRIDMNSLAQEHYAASLSGAPPGYAGSKEQFSLFDRETVEGTPNRPGVVLFDEVEKAHPTVLRALLQILDTGRLRLASGTSDIDFRNAVVLLTSNLGSREVHDLGRRSPSATARRVMRSVRGLSHREIVLERVRDFFDPELLNRFDEVIVFDAVDPTTARAIVDREIDGLIASLAGRGTGCVVTGDARELLLDRAFDARYGARALRRALRVHLVAPIAAAIADSDGPLELLVDVDGGGVRVTPTVVAPDAVSSNG
ncbi:AAA family ATPase [Williamsia deligens]|uniref:AAA family ATPase n=1 Tax=Williamsia deligens TaxID=321325 RepID=A0ABW3GC79_9NOCA|nr:AAA family ATPase [Williamsia deligens]MCP2192698.1 C-terminal, D2-small domain-containing protein, of ClpB protein [Williamsia deligens]